MPVRLDQFRQEREHGANIRPLDVLGLLRAYNCEDTRDKIYAALGMAMDVHEDDLVPDYQKSYRAVCIGVVDFYVSKLDHHTLDFLGGMFRSSPGTTFEDIPNTYQLSSWILDWTYRLKMYALEKDLDSDSFDTTMNVYSASGTLPIVCHVEDELLHLRGTIVDCLNSVWRVCEWNLRAGGLAMAKLWIPEEPDRPYVNRGTMMQAFNHTIVADVGRRDLQDNGLLSRDFSADWDLLGRDTAHMTAHERGRQSFMMIDIKAMPFGRRLFMTRRGF